MVRISIGPDDGQSIADETDRLYKGSSIVDFPEEYVCIDVETTGLDYADDEIIEVAALHVKNVEIIDKFVSLIRPQRSHAILSYGTIHKMGYESFTDVPDDVMADFWKEHLIPDSITQLTKITNDMLFTAPTEDVVMPQFFNFIGNQVLVGHNANFDVNFLYDACQRCGLTLYNHFIDTMRISRKILPELKHHRLSDLAERFGITQNGAHRAEDDVITTIKCFDALKELVLETWSIPDFVNWFINSSRVTSARSVRKIQEQKHFHPADLIQPDIVDSSHPLCGKTVVFTGELHLSRKESAQMAANVGAIVKTSVSGKTDFLIVGQQDITLVGSSGSSSKERKAHELNESGKGHIKILSEQEFVELVNSKVEAGAL